MGVAKGVTYFPGSTAHRRAVMLLESILYAASGFQDATLGSLSSFQIVLW